MSYYLFRTGTTGLQKIKKSKAFPSKEDAISAGQALNILEGTPDRIFIIIPEEDLLCYTNITDPLPFSESFFRYPRLSDSPGRFSPKNLRMSNLEAGLSISENHPALSLAKEKISSWENKSFFTILDSEGFNKSICTELQSHYQYQLGISPFPPQLSSDAQRFILIFNQLFKQDKKEINQYLSSLIMSGFKTFGLSETDSKIFSTKENFDDEDII